MKRLAFTVTILCSYLLSSCSSSNSPSTVGTTPVALWIAAASTTYISDAPTDTGTNMLLQGSLNIGLWDIPGIVSHHQVSFVKFVLPSLPPGSGIDHAYFEVYHGGQQEDGTTDNTQFWVSQIGVPFGFDTMTWNKSPDHGRYNAPPTIVCQLHSKDWCGTHDIRDTIQNWFNNPASNTGFRLNLASQSNYYKSFYSNRDLSRTDSTLGLAPRLLILLHIPDTTSSLAPLKTFGQLPPDANVRLGPYSRRTNLVIMDSLVTSSDFPASWNAKKGQ